MALQGPLSPPAQPLPGAGCPPTASSLPKTAQGEGMGMWDSAPWCPAGLGAATRCSALGALGLMTSSGGWAKVTSPCCCLLQERAESITTFALCGFANLSSIGIMLGGLGECDPRPGCLGTTQGDPAPGERGLSWGRRNVLPSSLRVWSLPAHR